MSSGVLPGCATHLLDDRHTFLLVTRRSSEDWVDDAIAVLRSSNEAEYMGLDPATVFEALTADDLRQNLLPVARRGAEDIVKLLLVGSFYSGPDASLLRPDKARDDCVRAILDTAGEAARYFTNHGHAEEGYEANFLTANFHFNSLAATLWDVCLIAASPTTLLIVWRFEDA
ncbi:hypothetical protein ACLGI4_11125 [Streptomyces sp. HMX112]|uniref:hypothetical protein n=1 Tax=Streptomyces sp. HMX112 TaxID=3390850 RepID=UPI003A81215F